MQSNQRSQFKKLVAQGKISRRFPQDGWTQEMFDKDFACHAQRMLRIKKHVDTSAPHTLQHPPPWLKGKRATAAAGGNSPGGASTF